MEIYRVLSDQIRDAILESNQVIVLYGPRQAGKTTLLKSLVPNLGLRFLSINGEESRISDVLSSRDLAAMRGLVGGYQLVFLDEAQRIPDIGINLKILHDGIPGLKLVVSGSSSLDLAGKTKEPLTGRTWTFKLFPISFYELLRHWTPFELDGFLPEALVLGTYPALFSLENRERKIRHLSEMSDAYLYKDVLELSGIRNPKKLRDLLRLLAYQIGSEVSLTELGAQLSMSKDTVASYIDLLEKAFVVQRLTPFSRNLRKEVVKKDKLLFLDNGVRNALIDDFKPFDQRNDQGMLWESFLIGERRKFVSYAAKRGNCFFWRTRTGAELDYVEERDGVLHGYEMKLSKTPKLPAAWTTAYPGATFQGISKANYLEFISGVGSAERTNGG